MKNSNEYGTPDIIFNKLNNHYDFEIDACASNVNHKCKKYWTQKEDAMKQVWQMSGNIFINPPYSAKCADKSSYGILEWSRKGFLESVGDRKVVLLIPSDTSTQYYKYCHERATYIHFLTPRVKFIGAEQSAKFGSMVVQFGGLTWSEKERIGIWRWKTEDYFKGGS